MTEQLEEDQFLCVREFLTHKAIVMQHPFFRYDPFRGTNTGEFVLDEKSLRTRIANLRKRSLPTNQSEMALAALLKSKGG